MYIDIFIYVYKLALHNTTNTRRIRESEHSRASPARLATSQTGVLEQTSSSPLKQKQIRRRPLRIVMEVGVGRPSPTPSNKNRLCCPPLQSHSTYKIQSKLWAPQDFRWGTFHLV